VLKNEPIFLTKSHEYFLYWFVPQAIVRKINDFTSTLPEARAEYLDKGVELADGSTTPGLPILSGI